MENFLKIGIFRNRCFRVCYHLHTKSMVTIVGVTVNDCIRNVFRLLYNAHLAIKVTIGHTLTLYVIYTYYTEQCSVYFGEWVKHLFIEDINY